MLDLFGVEMPDEPPHRYKNGYAKQPGSGPAGETCGSCAHYTHVHRGARYYLKCGLMEPSWTRGRGTDIKAKSPACSRWEKPEEEAMQNDASAAPPKYTVNPAVEVIQGRWVATVTDQNGNVVYTTPRWQTAVLANADAQTWANEHEQ